jgi:ABC-type transport system involved in cytochrome c biogenesis permease subunit
VLLFSLVPWRNIGNKIILPAGAVIGFLSLLISTHVALDPAINPLVPALQSIWLNIHVIVILLGYSSATLAMGVGHVWIVQEWRDPRALRKLAPMTQAINRLVMFTVMFLSIGIILGSVWAQSAWGRYWGWDPKETWALLTMFFYLILVHAGSTGWLKPKGLAVSTIFGFLLVLFTYYGVNYWLVGLHSYAGGESRSVPPLMIAYVLADLAFVGAYLFATRKRGVRTRRGVKADKTVEAGA